MTNFKADEIEYEIKRYLNNLEDVTLWERCGPRCNVCSIIIRYQKAWLRVQSGAKLTPEMMKGVKHPLLRERLLNEICLRAARRRVE